MAATQEDALSRRYPHIPRDRLRDMIEIEASEDQLLRVDNSCKKATDEFLQGNRLQNIRYTSIPMEQNITIAVIGKTGAGKSATGNALYGSDVFAEGSSANAVTLTESWKTTTYTPGRPMFTIIDTPGSWNISQQRKPDLYVLVVNLSSRRFDREDLKRVRKIKARTRILLLTHARSGLNGITLESYLQEIRGDPLEEFIRQDMERWRVLAIENSCSTPYEKSEQRAYILSMLTEVYTSIRPTQAATTRDIESGSSSTCNMRKDNIVIAILGIVFVVIIIIVLALAFG